MSEKKVDGKVRVKWSDICKEVKKLKIGENYYACRNSVDLYFERVTKAEQKECLGKMGGNSRILPSEQCGRKCPDCGGDLKLFHCSKTIDGYGDVQNDGFICKDSNCRIRRWCVFDYYGDDKASNHYEIIF